MRESLGAVAALFAADKLLVMGGVSTASAHVVCAAVAAGAALLGLLVGLLVKVRLIGR